MNTVFTYMKLVVEHLHPTVLFPMMTGSKKDSLFMSPEVWREFFKEPQKTL